MGLRRAVQGRDVAAQKRIAGDFVAQQCGQAGLATVALRLGLAGAYLQGGVVGVDGQREGGIGECVLVAAANLRVVGQRSQPLQRCQHLRRLAFEHAAAAQREQGVAAEQHAFTVVSDMTGGMAGERQDGELPRADLDAIAVFDMAGRQGDAGIAGGEDRGAWPVRQQCGHATDVVAVVVGEQDRVRRHSAQCRQHRCGIAGIDHQRTAATIAQQPHVVVIENGDRFQVHLSSRDVRRAFPQNHTMPPPMFQRQSDPVAAEAWFAGDAGRNLLESEAACVEAALRQRPGQAHLWLGPAVAQAQMLDAGPVLRLRWTGGEGFRGDLRCALPLPVASESCAVVVIQHLMDLGCDHAPLLEECARVLLPGAEMWLLGLNPLSPFRFRWRGQGLQPREPITWRRRLRAAGLHVDGVTRGLGPSWGSLPDPAQQDGAGLRAAFLLRAGKRRMPLTPVRRPRALTLASGTPA